MAMVSWTSLSGALGGEPLALADSGIRALAMPALDHHAELVNTPRLNLDDTAAVAGFLEDTPLWSPLRLARRASPATRLADYHLR